MDDRRKTCWYDENTTPEKMLEGASGKLFPTLEYSDHWPILKLLIDKCSDIQTILDVGCGAAALSELVELEYTGCDLPHIIEKVAKVHAPNTALIPFDFYDSDLTFVSNYDLVVANAFIDVLNDPLVSLRRIMDKARSHVIVHRQRLADTTTGYEKVGSYTGFAYSSVLSVSDINELCKEKNFEIQCVVPWSQDAYSFLIKKI